MRLFECLHGQTGSYIRPLIWYSGESKEKLAREIRAVKSAGINEFIVENRGGDWFDTPKWYEVLETALQTAQELDMRMWLLDDTHVNSGSANDSLRKEENARFRPQNLRLEVVDFAGPVHAGAVMVPTHTAKEKIVAVSAYRRDELTGNSTGEGIDLTGGLTDELCLVDLPEGFWRIYFILTVDPAKQGFFGYYISMLSEESCRHLLDEIHEKIYARFPEYFGNTFAGFFTYEPAFGNCDGQYSHDSCEFKMGELRRFYPWWDTMPVLLMGKTGFTDRELMLKLPAIWDNIDGISEQLRIDYMDVITDQWRKNFSYQPGKWCEDHGVEYIGHTLEDRGAHFRTGWGCGHFFRAMEGQHMAGMDIVLNQFVPGFTTMKHTGNSSKKEFEPLFYYYTLPKLGSSLAHITPHMKNRSICEVFGAYGWTCGLPVMRSIFNHFLAGGTNNFMPHAFSLHLPGVVRESCGEEETAPPGYCMTHMAPTFYMGNMNPQYRFFGELMRYVQRSCHLISDGTHLCDVALFYAAEADWCNRDNRNMDEVSAKLLRSGIDFDFIPSDALFEKSAVANGRLMINGESYGALVVPMAEYLPEKLLDRFAELSEAGLPVIFTDRLPSNCGDRTGFRTAALDELPEAVKKLNVCRLQMTPAPDNFFLRYFGVENRDGSVIYLLYNSSMRELNTGILPDCGGKCVLYDPWENRTFRCVMDNGYWEISLKPQQLLAAVFTEGSDEELPEYPYEVEFSEIDPDFDIFIRETGEKDFRILRKNSKAVNLLVEEKLTRCCAEFRYDTVISWHGGDADFLQIPSAGDCAELFINGQYCGCAIGPVCRFHISGMLRDGENTVSIITADNPAYFDRNDFEKNLYGTKLPLTMHGFCGKLQTGKIRRRTE